MNTSFHQNRRGMLLLLVMLMLSLFMAIGAWLLTITLRSRASARAYGSASLAAAVNDNLSRQVLDEALMLAVRGGTNGCVAVASTVEPLLADKYGPPITATANIVSGASPPAAAPALVMRLSLTDFTPFISGTFSGSRLNGRLLTFKSKSAGPVTYRILSATNFVVGSSGTITCDVANLPSQQVLNLGTGPFEAVINGREFPTAGVLATGSVTISSGTVASITVTGSGANYSPLHPPAVVIDPPPAGDPATATAAATAVVDAFGRVTGFNVIRSGSGYPATDSTTGPPRVWVAMPQAESYDGYDDTNPLIAKPVFNNGALDRFDRISFFGNVGAGPLALFDGPYDKPINDETPATAYPLGVSGTSIHRETLDATKPWLMADGAVDNDNDGVLDGVWLPSDQIIQNAIASGSATPPPYVIADRPSPLGGNIRFQVSYLILDLDGRINVNAAGMAAPGSYAGVPAEAQNVPLGMGYGPADIDPSVLFSGSIPAADGIPTFIKSGTNPTNPWNALLLNGTPAFSGTVPTPDQRRTPPKFAYLEGRYGPNGVPGIFSATDLALNDDSSASQTTTNTGSNSSYQRLISGTNLAIADVQGRRKLYMAEPATGQWTPRLTTFTGTTTASGSAAANQDARNDPYELRLDADSPRPGVVARTPAELALLGNRNDDNPFTLGELERILRPNDSDALQLPQRLAAGLGDFAQRNRMTVTTDSWDTPGLTGNPARLVEEFLASGLTYTGTQWRTTTLASGSSHPIPPDIAAGLKFDLNRPIANASDRHEYCKGLYSLVVMLAGDTATDLFKDRAAQWAVNVLDFRDEDSTMTGFEYDTNIADGWNVDGDPKTSEATRKLVWGVERPEILIVETAASHPPEPGNGQLLINLMRIPETTATSTTLLTGTSDLVAPANPKAWQIRFQSHANPTAENPNRVVQFFNPAGGTDNQKLLASGTLTPRLSAVSAPTSDLPAPLFGFDSPRTHLCIEPAGGPQPPYSIQLPKNRELSVQADFQLKRQLGPEFMDNVFLERLADVNRQNGDDNPYIVVDTARVRSRVFPALGGFPPRKSRRPGPKDLGPLSLPHEKPWLTALWQQPADNDWVLDDQPQLREYEGHTDSDKRYVPYFHWPNRPFISQAELAHVPSLNANEMLKSYSFPNTQVSGSSTSLALDSMSVNGNPINGISGAPASLAASDTLGNLILEATYVPSRFAGNVLTNSSTTSLPLCRELGLDILQSSSATIQSGSAQLSKWREPGKINVNTIVPGINPSTDNKVWMAVLSGTQVVMRTGSGTNITTGTITTNPFVSVSGSSFPATSISQLMATGTSLNRSLPMETFTTNASQPDLRDLNPFFSYWRANRLANTATIRSQVFAVWITVRITDDSPNAPSPVTKRMFAIIDRSIPAGYAPGQDLNVRDTIRLKRYLD
jgi:hypothetical protein